jgi:hypothetical protein
MSLRFRVQALAFRLMGSKLDDSGFRVYSLGFGV